MKSKILFFALMMMNVVVNAQVQYEVTTAERHNKQKVLRGIVTKEIISKDTSFGWYAPNQKYYTPDTAAVSAMKATKGKVQFVIFGGTWCEDTQSVLPQFFKLQETSSIGDDQITLFAVNEDKKSLGNITSAFGITNVPTIIVMKDNKEIGRVVEYGKSGKWDKDLAEILNQAK